MSAPSNPSQGVPFLRVQRNFPVDPQALSVELSKSYIDIASSVNFRTMGIFSENAPSANGEFWYLTSAERRQQGIRRVYPFTAAGSIAHGITTSQIGGFTRIYGTFTNGTNWYPLPYVDVVAANNQVNIVVTPTNIVITAGGGAPPAITRGFVVLEWITT
jgi:hypothetical protein